MRKLLVHNLPIYTVLATLVIIVAITTHPLGFSNYGYDYGFYSYAVQHTPLNSLTYFAGQVNDYGTHLFVILNWLRLPQVQTMDFLFLIFFVTSAILFYEIIKKYGRLVTTTGIILFAFSIAQSQLYTMFLWKAAYGQVLLLLIFLLLEQKQKYHWELIPLALLFITHKTSSIIALTSLAPQYLFGVVKNKVFIIGTVVTGALIFLFALNGLNYSKQLLNSDVQNGLFLQVSLYIKYSWYLIPMASIGVYKSIKNKVNLQWLGLLAVSLLFIIFKITFYQRLILYADLTLIFFSVVSMYELRHAKFQQNIFVGLCIVLSISGFALFVKENISPKISGNEITEIQNFSQTHQGAFVLSLSAEDGPWLLANLGGNIRLAAPGLFEDKYSKTTWESFWSNPKNEQFLNSYDKPLYLYQRSSIFYDEQNLWQCLNKISDHFYQYTCAK